MERMQLKRRKSADPQPQRGLEQGLRRQMAWAAGTEYFQHRDPLYHVTESFQQTFDAMGRRHAAQLSPQEQAPGQASPGEQAQGREETPDPTSARSFYERDRPENQDMLRRFSETAFQRGTLSGAVLQGTGQMMLFSCLKKTVGQSQPDKWQQRKLFEKASPLRSVPGHNPDKVVFNRGFTHSAVGLVVDTLRDARRTVEDMQSLVLGKMDRTEAGFHGADTLRAMYPFLDDSRERELLEQYRQQLEGADDLREKAALQSAIGRMEALVGKKAQMKQEFINKLRFLSDRANEALEVFEAPGFAETLDQALREATGAEEPPPDEEGGGPDDGTAADPEPGAAEDGEAVPEGGGAPDSGAGAAGRSGPDGPGGAGGRPPVGASPPAPGGAGRPGGQPGDGRPLGGAVPPPGGGPL